MYLGLSFNQSAKSNKVSFHIHKLIQIKMRRKKYLTTKSTFIFKKVKEKLEMTKMISNKSITKEVQNNILK